MLVYADHMNLLGDNINTTKKNTETLIDASKELGLEENTEKTNKGMVRSDRSKPALIFFFTARVHTTKSTIKFLAAKMHCKYFLKIAEVTHFSVRGTLVSEVCTTFPSV
jgi:hypothetical protein